MSDNTSPHATPVAPTSPTHTTPEQQAAVKALMDELHKKTSAAIQAVAEVPPGLVSDTIKLG